MSNISVSSEEYRATADSLYDWLDDNSNVVCHAIEYAIVDYLKSHPDVISTAVSSAVEEYVKNYGIGESNVLEE